MVFLAKLLSRITAPEMGRPVVSVMEPLTLAVWAHSKTAGKSRNAKQAGSDFGISGLDSAQSGTQVRHCVSEPAFANRQNKGQTRKP